MTRWDLPAYIAKLPEMPLRELCARLRGEYADASYGKHPLHAEAARRLEAMKAEIEANARCQGVQPFDPVVSSISVRGQGGKVR